MVDVRWTLTDLCANPSVQWADLTTADVNVRQAAAVQLLDEMWPKVLRLLNGPSRGGSEGSVYGRDYHVLPRPPSERELRARRSAVYRRPPHFKVYRMPTAVRDRDRHRWTVRLRVHEPGPVLEVEQPRKKLVTHKLTDQRRSPHEATWSLLAKTLLPA